MEEPKEYQPIKIPPSGTAEHPLEHTTTPVEQNFPDTAFAEIEIEVNSTPIDKSIPIPKPTWSAPDEKRTRFNAMRAIAQNDSPVYAFDSKYYFTQAKLDTSRIFYQQALFMADFEDDYADSAPFSCYFPYYQLMNYEQLRTYFTWRTKVRKGTVPNTYLSYAFLYLYELLGQIGFDHPVDALEKLMEFWNAFRFYYPAIVKYIVKWVKDFHIYYELPWTFQAFIHNNNLESHYPDIVEYTPDNLSLFEKYKIISKYDITQSVFYSDETKQLIDECFEFVLESFSKKLNAAGLDLQDFLLHPTKSNSVWIPFSGALFYSNASLPDKRITLSENEIYLCKENKWYLHSAVPTDSGKQLIGYLFKKTEAELRTLTSFKYKLTANFNSLNSINRYKLNKTGIPLEKEIIDAVKAFYKEKTKTVVSVNETALHIIRREALDTQEKLIVPEQEIIPNLTESKEIASTDAPQCETPPISPIPTADSNESAVLTNVIQPEATPSESAVSDVWTSLKNALNEIELRALAATLAGGQMFKQIADESGLMAEVLADGINEKAFDLIGDNILEYDGEVTLYDDYRDEIASLL